ncbi:hypothetical protein EVAR_80481_1 [Eumeta japonica]|uniref:Uncharacterized protein n=1 Tax=Eumeta variegata TaxID=151549 RepID=A0A4C1YP73_EUMVA|nr:hypothetical protein EVAR_80481_1 [Eumeta japonica]
MINRPASSPARRNFRKNSQAEKRVLLEADPRPAGRLHLVWKQNTSCQQYIQTGEQANHRNIVFAKLLRTPGVSSARSVEMCSENAHVTPTYKNLGHCERTNSIEKQKTANERERVKLSSVAYDVHAESVPGARAGQRASIMHADPRAPDAIIILNNTSVPPARRDDCAKISERQNATNQLLAAHAACKFAPTSHLTPLRAHGPCRPLKVLPI